ncbi:hypothetical protein SAY87_018138 [Trapa incisa]|uniref:GDU1 n=1 Tax=Trapa incisa TaxID=236973 RepID=A0AAN7LB92_9MYRT|nr:hypothetical protein SAY87_018138 [Trapa incisa]
MAAARGHFNLTSNAAAMRSTTADQSQSQSWQHSPVTYLFAGLAAMLGLIAFALLILACSYWRLSGYFNGGGTTSSQRDPEAGGEAAAAAAAEAEGGTAKGGDFEEKVVVIMAGEKEPRFLATPASSSRSSSFGESSSSSSCSRGDEISNARGSMV